MRTLTIYDPGDQVRYKGYEPLRVTARVPGRIGLVGGEVNEVSIDMFFEIFPEQLGTVISTPGNVEEQGYASVQFEFSACSILCNLPVKSLELVEEDNRPRLTPGETYEEVEDEQDSSNENG